MTDATPGYPPSPWNLRGQLHASVFLVPVAAFPPGELDLPPGWSLVLFRGQAVVGAAWVDYQPGGDMTYRELMATVLVRRGRRVAPHIVRIWVDSIASRDGGRALWAIPKELAEFAVDGADGGSSRRRTTFRAAAPQDAGAPDSAGRPQPLAVASLRRGLRLPGTIPVRFSLVQRRNGAAVVSPVRLRAGLALTRARWIAEPFGPLGFLHGRRATLTVSLRDFRMVFGAAPSDVPSDDAVVNAP